MTGCHSGQLLITDLLYKNLQDEQLNSTRFPVFPEGISNSSRFPVFTEVADTLKSKKVAINVVALRQTRLVPGWVTICGRVHHLCM